MTQLVIEDIQSSGVISQTVNLTQDKVYQIESISAYLFNNGSPAGNFKFEVKNGADVLFTHAFTSADLKTYLSTADDYFRLLYNMKPSTPLMVRGIVSLTFELSAVSGYTYSPLSSIAWVKEYDNLYNTISGTPASDADNPFTFRIYEKQKLLE